MGTDLHRMGKKRVIQKTETELLEETKASEREGLGKAGPRESLRKIREGRIYIFSSYNNTIMSLTDERGNTLKTVSAGGIGFKGTKKATPFAASKVADVLGEAAKSRGIEKVGIFVKGIGSGRDSALRSLGTKGFEILSIKDITPIPHNGPRPPKVRRV